MKDHRIQLATFWLMLVIVTLQTVSLVGNFRLRARVERLESRMGALARHTAELAGIVAENIKEKDE